MPADKRTPSPESIAALEAGALEIAGRLPWSSNFTFLVDVTFDEFTTRAIYKPFQGEQELWDFPDGLYKREVAAYELSVALGWPNIPETVVREDAPFGVGSLQLFIPSDFEQHYFTLMESSDNEQALKTIATFDIVANNADRKAGHCLISESGDIYAIDNALCFHAEPKLRTVIWDFENQAVDGGLIKDLEAIKGNLPGAVTQYLEPAEVEALDRRIEELLADPRLPQLRTQRQYPWPLI